MESNSTIFLTSERDGYGGGGREPRSYMERPSAASYRDPYDGYGKIDHLSAMRGGNVF